VTTRLTLVVVFTTAGLLLIYFRNPISRFGTDLNQGAFPFLPRALTVRTPGGVVLVAMIFFFLALLVVLAILIGAA
jgi:hypothetical protein